MLEKLLMRPMHRDFLKELKKYAPGKLMSEYNAEQCRLEIRILDWMSFYECTFYVDDGDIFECSVNCISRQELCRRIASLYQHHHYRFCFEDLEFMGPITVTLNERREEDGKA